MARQTEDRLERYRGAEHWPPEECLEAMLDNQSKAICAVRAALPELARASVAAAARLGADEGRLIYAGAGSAGRLAVLDGVELWPTFSWPPERLAFLLAGGEAALVRSVEGAEDDVAAAEAAVEKLEAGRRDVLVAVAASGSTPFTRAVVRRARRRGALTIAIANNRGAPLLAEAEHPILLATGAEFLAGSTRMTAGTAQKIALNLLSTRIMMALGRVHQGYMVALVPGNAKLVERARRMVADLAGVTPEEAAEALRRAAGEVRLAVLLLEGLEPEEARRRLAAAGGDLARARRAAPQGGAMRPPETGRGTPVVSGKE